MHFPLLNVARAGCLTVAAVSLLAGCNLFRVGDAPSETPPHLEKSYGNSTVWNFAKNFGPVPPDLQEKGNQYCHDQGLKDAEGYHPKALDVDGKPFPGGGFLCKRPDS